MMTYIVTGRVNPERAIADISEVSFTVQSSGDVPTGELFIEVVRSQICARYVCEGSVTNANTLRNIVEDASRTLLDALGFSMGYGYDVEITQMMRADSSEKYVFGIDVPALRGVCDAAGVTFENVINAMAKPDGSYLRHALADAREAIKSPRDTGFFCYRAIELRLTRFRGHRPKGEYDVQTNAKDPHAPAAPAIR
jgi:hypothetical protein